MRRCIFHTFLGILVGAAIGVMGVFGYLRERQKSLSEQSNSKKQTQLARVAPDGTQLPPLERYAFEALRKTTFTPSRIHFMEPSPTPFGRADTAADGVIARAFEFYVEGKKVTGLAHYPARSTKPAPVIIQLRGFVDPSIYKPGIGSARVGQELARAGYLALAPDFLGYGGSDPEPAYPLEARFMTYVTTATLLASLENLPSSALPIETDPERVGIWAHSNGGQIALSTLAFTGRSIPTVLWAPVTKPFPFSVLYYTDEFADEGKSLREVIADFEDLYDISQYTVTNYYDWITAPLQLHQGGNDDAVPRTWSDQFAAAMREKGKEIEYHLYPGSDHNMQPDWNTAVSRTVAFFNEKVR